MKISIQDLSDEIFDNFLKFHKNEKNLKFWQLIFYFIEEKII